MKKLLCIGIITSLVFMTCGVAFATDQSASDPLPQASGNTGDVLFIDNENLYPGMDKPYSNGYMPSVSNGTASIILPLVSDQDMQGDSINITIDLGSPADSPFVFQNFNKTVKYQEHFINNSETAVKAYLVEFSLPLSDTRVNGRYSVTVKVQGQVLNGASFEQAFPLYITVTDGIDPDAEPEPIPDTIPEQPEDILPETSSGGGGGPVSQPKIIIEGYSVSPSPVLAGDVFDLSVTLKNTSDSQSIRNAKITVTGETTDISTVDETNSYYFERIKAEETIKVNAKMGVQPATEPKPQKVLIHIEYEGSNATAYTSDETIVIQITQPIRLEYDEPEIPKEVNAGDSISLGFNVMNMGKSTVYNVKAELDAPGLIPEGSLYLGNLESGSSKQGDMYIFVGTLDYEGRSEDSTDKYGISSGIITLTYEDEFGEVSEETIEFSTVINPPIINVTAEEPEEPDTESQWWVSVIIAAIVICAILAIWLFMRRKKRIEEDEDV